MALSVLLWPRAGLSPAQTLWAEDGRNFLGGALRHSLWQEFFRPYGGYLQALPRLIGAGAALLPLRDAAAAFAATSASVRVAIAWLTYRAAAGHLPSPGIRFLLAAAIVLLPTANFEALDDAANLHWFVLYALFWLLLWRGPNGWLGTGLAGVAAATGVASEPLALLLAPLALLRAWALPARYRATAYGFAAGMAAQLVVILTGPPRGTARQAPIGTAIGAWLVRGPLTALIGTAESVHLYRLAGYVPALVATGLILACALLAAFGSAATRWLAALSLALSLLIFGLIVFYDWAPALAPSSPGVVFPGDRYNLTPDLLLLTTVCAGLQALRRASGKRPAGASPAYLVALGLVVAGLVTATVTTFAQPSGRTAPPTWRAALSAARRSCRSEAMVVPAPLVVRVPIDPAGWAAAISCRKLLH